MSVPDSRRAVVGALLLLLAGFSAQAVAADTASPQAVIEARQASLKKMGAAMKTLVDQMKADAPDTARMTAAAQVIASYAADLGGWFPVGSGTEAGVDTDALPYIWEARPKFDAIAGQLAPEAGKLITTLSGGDLSAVRGQVKALGSVCSNCHKSFRED